MTANISWIFHGASRGCRLDPLNLRITSSGSAIADAGHLAMIAMPSTRSAANRSRYCTNLPLMLKPTKEEFRRVGSIGNGQRVPHESLVRSRAAGRQLVQFRRLKFRRNTEVDASALLCAGGPNRGLLLWVIAAPSRSLRNAEGAAVAEATRGRFRPN